MYIDELKSFLIPLVLCIVILFAVICGLNVSRESDWNNGICPDCNVRYELRGAQYMMKLYACPKCGKEVGRY